jgi:hypothetical protein
MGVEPSSSDITSPPEGPSPLYSSLDQSRAEIRLLKVLPLQSESHRETVRCSLVTDSLGELNYSYVALSYVWGDPGVNHLIMVNGHPLEVTANLDEFLQRYRYLGHVAPHWEFANRYVWVDAVCINQNDLPERINQVSLMGDIYRSASAAIAWLGPDADDSDYASQYVREMSDKIYESQQREDSDVLGWLDAADTHLWTADLGVDHQPEPGRFTAKNRFWNSVMRMFERPYVSYSSI